MTLALDTSTLIDVMRSRDVNVRREFMGLDAARAVVPVVVLHELISGADIGASPQRERARIAEVLSELAVIALEPSDIEATAAVRSDLHRRGRPIGDIDTLIAGQALARGWTVVTRNVRHFGRVEGLPLIDWATGPQPLSVEAITARVSDAG